MAPNVALAAAALDVVKSASPVGVAPSVVLAAAAEIAPVPPRDIGRTPVEFARSE
ncbi:MAG: hypothetical protein DDT31_00203 [Syntrophomonadaceae bacterium]|nr:hypothetical protein [Bacillota bacterium]